jgi:hypothetical protein
VYALSLGFGVDAREFWPATAAGATKADAAIQHLKARGKGIGDLIQTIERALNWWVIGENAGVEFKFDYTDDEQDREVADLQQVRITNLTQMVTTGIITSQEARSLAIAQGLIDVTALDTTQNPDQADDSAPLVPNEDQASVPEDTPPPDATLDSKGIKVRASIKQDEILAETPPEPPVIQGEPLSRDQATFVSEFDADEIAALFDAFHKLPKVSKLPKPESSEPTKSVEAA